MYLKKPLLFIILFTLFTTDKIEAQVPQPDLGKRADWMRGTYGLNWKPGKGANGNYESKNYTIDHFLEQINHLKTVDYIQLHLNESNIYSPVHAAPHDLIESFWKGDMNDSNPINLVVPRNSIGKDPFLDIIHDQHL